jgi:hypothetical protein
VSFLWLIRPEISCAAIDDTHFRMLFKISDLTLQFVRLDAIIGVEKLHVLASRVSESGVPGDCLSLVFLTNVTEAWLTLG